MACNVCDAKLRAAWSAAPNAASVKPFGQKCPSCGSRPRIRAMAYAVDNGLRAKLEELRLLGTARSLLMAAPRVERDLLDGLIGPYVTMSLYGSYSDDHIYSNAEDLKEFEAQSFDLAEASGVFDFIEGAERAFESVSRVLRPTSVFFFHIGGGHLKDGDMAPTLNPANSSDRSISSTTSPSNLIPAV